MGDFRFQSPWFLLLLILVVPLLIKSWRSTTGAAIRYSSLASLRSLPFRRGLKSRKILPLLRALALGLFMIALARPQTGKALTEINTEAVDILLVMDTSGSMRALDFILNKERITRLDAAKNVVAEFIKNRPTDRLGMVVFGEQAFTQCPLTLDHGVLLSFLDQIEVGMAGDATAMGSAIGVGTKRLKDLKSKSKVMILLTDGSSNAGVLSPLQASEIAKTFGVKIYTIGIGSKGKAPFMVEGVFGRQLVYHEVDMDEDTLRQIAAATNGRYFRATDMDSLKTVYAEIDRMEKTSVKTKQYLDYTEHFLTFVAFGLVFLTTEIILANTRFRKLP